MEINCLLKVLANEFQYFTNIFLLYFRTLRIEISQKLLLKHKKKPLRNTQWLFELTTYYIFYLESIIAIHHQGLCTIELMLVLLELVVY
jgi:hypothetical protein